MARMCRLAPATSTRCLSCWGFPDPRTSDDANGRCSRRYEHAAHENRGEPCRGRADEACVHDILHLWVPRRGDGAALTASFKEVPGDATISSLGSMEAKRPTKSAFEATDLHCVL